MSACAPRRPVSRRRRWPAQAGSVELVLDLVEHVLVARSSRGDALAHPLCPDSRRWTFCATVLDHLHRLGAEPEVDRSDFSADRARV